MIRKPFNVVWLVFLTGLFFFGCGDSSAPQRPDLQSLGTGKADMPEWLREINADWACGQTLQGAFEGRDSAHAYTFQLAKGLRYSFEFSADYARYKGAAVALFNLDTGARVAIDRNLLDNKASITYTTGEQESGTYVVAVYSVLWEARGKYTLRAICDADAFGEPFFGQSQFSSLEHKRYSWNRSGPVSLEGVAKTAGLESAPSGRDGEVEEADIYKIDSNRLFYLNTYRGFMIFDINDPKQPKLISRLPVYGYPVEMFVQNSTVYALIRDALYMTQKAGSLSFARRNVSQLVAIDISSPASPKVLQTVDIVGHLREGVSRKIGDTIYVASYQPSGYFWGWQRDNQQPDRAQAWVYAFNVASPTDLKLVDQLKVFEGGTVNTYDPESTSYESRYFNSLTISATANALMVVENWSTYGSVWGSTYNCGSSRSLQEAVVSVIDISDPTGKITLHTTFKTYGQVGDQFKQTYVYDDATGKGTYMGIFARREWETVDCKGSSRIENTLEAWDITSGDNPQRVGQLRFGKPDETVRGSVFDAERKVAFAITARAVDPLYAISFADPSNLHVLSEVDGLSGDMNVFRFIGDKKFLIGIGRDNSETCTGFGDPATGWASNVAVSIIDVKDLNQIRLVQRRCVTIKNAAWIGSSVNWNLDQAHKMIGMHSDGLANIISVPVYYSKKIDDDGGAWPWYRQETAVGLMAWDLTQYDPSKSELEQNVLQTFGTVIHPQGEVKRSIVFSHQGVATRRKMINLSDTHLSLVDLEDLDQPVHEAEVEIAPYIRGVYRFGNYLVHQVGASWGSDRPAEFRVKVAGPYMEQAPVKVSFKVGGYIQQVLKFKDNLVIFRRPMVTTLDAQPLQPTMEALVYSLSDPEDPQHLSTAVLPFSYAPYWRYWCGTPAYWFGYSNALALTDRAIVMLRQEWSYETKQQTVKLVFMDLSNPAAPQVSEQVLETTVPEGTLGRTYLDLVTDSTAKDSVYINYREALEEVTISGAAFEKVKYYIQPWSHDGAAWVKGSATNIPGQLIKSWTDLGIKHLLTHDKIYDLQGDQSEGAWRESTRLNLLMEVPSYSAPIATLMDWDGFTGFSLRDVVFDGNKLYVNANESSSYSPGPGLLPYRGGWSYQPPENRLTIFTISWFRLNEDYHGSLGTEGADIMGTHKNRLFLNLYGDGILVVDATDPENPSGHQFVRTLGWASMVEFFNKWAYVPAGYYGVYQLDLEGGSQMQQE